MQEDQQQIIDHAVGKTGSYIHIHASMPHSTYTYCMQAMKHKTNKQDKPPAAPIALMFASAALWGSNPVALRYVFTAATTSIPSPAAMTVIHTGIAAAALYLAAVWTGRLAHASLLTPAAPLVENISIASRSNASNATQPSSWTIQQILTWNAPTMHIAAMELGALAAVANAITVVGFQHSPATHGAFLFRLSAGLTPVISVLAGDPIKPMVCLFKCV